MWHGMSHTLLQTKNALEMGSQSWPRWQSMPEEHDNIQEEKRISHDMNDCSGEVFLPGLGPLRYTYTLPHSPSAPSNTIFSSYVPSLAIQRQR
jgi:hypothetical protein